MGGGGISSTRPDLARRLLRDDAAAVLAEAGVRAGSAGPDQQRLHQRRPDRLDEGGGLPQLQEALRGSVPGPEALHQGAAVGELQREHLLQYPLTGQRGGSYQRGGGGLRSLSVPRCHP